MKAISKVTEAETSKFWYERYTFNLRHLLQKYRIADVSNCEVQLTICRFVTMVY
jgi:hypothetical protein